MNFLRGQRHAKALSKVDFPAPLWEWNHIELENIFFLLSSR